MDWILTWISGDELGFVVDGSRWFLLCQGLATSQADKGRWHCFFWLVVSNVLGRLRTESFTSYRFAGTAEILMEWTVTWTRACLC
jgi:hypothetical protein